MAPIIKKIDQTQLPKIGVYGFAVFAPFSIALAQISIGLSLVGWIIKMIYNKSIVWKHTALDIPILIYVCTQLIAVFFSIDVIDGFKGWIDTDWFILFYYATIHLIEDRDDYKKIITILAISGGLNATYGILQHFTGIDLLGHLVKEYAYGNVYRALGFFTLPLTYGGIQMCLFLILLPFLFIKEGLFQKKWFLASVSLIFFSIIASYARSAWLGLGSAIFLLIFFLPRKLILYLITALSATVILIYFIRPDLLFTMGIFSMFDVSENAPYNNLVRIRLWESTWNLIKDNWLFGIGYSHFAEIFEQYKIPFDYRGLADPHNDLLKVFALSGIFGIIAFIYLWIRDLKTKLSSDLANFFNEPDLWKAGMFGSFFAVLAFLVAGLTQEYYHDAETAELWWFVVALGMIGVLKSKE